jgi:hypothetical protein
MQKDQKRGEGWRVARDGSVNVEFKLNVNNREDRELLDLLQDWRRAGRMRPTLKKAILQIAAVEIGTHVVVEATWFKSIVDRLDHWLSTPLPQPVDTKPVHPGGLKPLAGAKALAMPVYDDDDSVEVKQDMNAGASTTANFLDAAFGFQETPQ